jgi:hypothetical protein
LGEPASRLSARCCSALRSCLRGDDTGMRPGKLLGWNPDPGRSSPGRGRRPCSYRRGVVDVGRPGLYHGASRACALSHVKAVRAPAAPRP